MPVTQLVAIDDYLIDCSLNEQHTFESDVTEYPVESGSNITDNIRPKPVVVEMECLVSNTPIGVIINSRNLVRGTGTDLFQNKPADDCYELLQIIRDQRKPVTIRTSLRTFENMALKNLSIPRSAGRGDELRFTATFQQILTVENKRTIRVAIPNATGTKKVSKAPEESDTRQILIDPVNFAWFDPDVGLWRRYAKWYQVDVLDTESSVAINYVKSTWRYHLYRKKTFPIEHKASGPWIPPLVLVTLNQCVLHDFTIKKTFGGITQPFANLNNNVLKGRTTSGF